MTADRNVARIPRSHRIALLVIALVGLARGSFWAFSTIVTSPIDEMQHFGYVRSIAEGDGIPTVGRDHLPDDVLSLVKASPDVEYRSLPFLPRADDASWGSSREQYEAVQGPTYYVLMAVPSIIGHWIGGALASLYAVRLASVVVSLAAIPLLYWCGRELFPARPEVGLGAAAVLASVQGFNGNFAFVNNDGLMTILSIASVAVLLHTRRRMSWKDGLLLGIVFGLTVLTKLTALAMLPFLALLALPAAWRRPDRLHTVAAYGAAVAGGILVVISPWVVFNLVTYGAPTAAAATKPITGGMQAVIPLGWSGLQQQFQLSRLAFWEVLLGNGTHYRPVFEIAVLVLPALASIGWWRRRQGEGLPLLWLAAALPSAFLSMVLMISLFLGGEGTVMGRYLYVALGPICLLLAASLAIVLGPRWWVVGMAGLLVLALHREQSTQHHYLLDRYTQGVLGDLVPAVDQSTVHLYQPLQAFDVDPPCAVAAVGVVVDGEPPLAVVGGRADLATEGRDGMFTVYRLPEAAAAGFTFGFDRPAAVGVVPGDVEPRLEVPGTRDEVAARLYCASPRAREERFEQVFWVMHPRVPYRAVRGWSTGWFLVAVGATIGATARCSWLELRDRRRS